jgi:hypothetical protein
LYSSLIAPKVTVWSNGTYTLLLDATSLLEDETTELLDFTLDDDDFTELLLEAILEEDDLSELLLCILLEDEPTEELDSVFLLLDVALLLDSLLLEEDWRFPLEAGMTEEEDFALLLDFTLLLDSLLLEEDWRSPLEAGMTEEEDSSSMLLDESSGTGSTKLLLSSSQAAKRKILAIKNTIPMCPTHFNDDKSPNFFIFLLQILSPKYNQKPVFIKLAKLSQCSRA